MKRRIDSTLLRRADAQPPAVVSALLGLTFGICGCNGNAPTHAQVQQQAAQTTVAVRNDAKNAVDATRKAAAEAESGVNDVAKGVKQGLNENTAAPGTASAGEAEKVNINTASLVQLATLPGISFTKAGQIVSKRPYASEKQLVTRGVLSESEFAKIEPQVTIEP